MTVQQQRKSRPVLQAGLEMVLQYGLAQPTKVRVVTASESESGP